MFTIKVQIQNISKLTRQLALNSVQTHAGPSIAWNMLLHNVTLVT